MGVEGCGKVGNGELLSNGHRASAGGDENVLAMEPQSLVMVAPPWECT